jgi:polyhydroxyalkanoate synthesis regulator phasin
VSTFWRLFDDLADAEKRLNPGMEVDKTTISGEKLQDALVSGGKFTQSDAAIIIKDMTKDGLIEEVSWDRYRRRQK